MAESKYDGDWILRRLAGMVNRLPDTMRMEVPITLTVQGLVIAGLLVSRREYHQETARQISDWFQGFQEDQQSRIRREVQQTFDESLKTPEDDYIHLRAARICYPSSLSPMQVDVLWRGKITSVDGFWLAEVTEVKL
ncbi:MAG: hypothetical protein EHM18_03845 [Acidobacteria bacterium]|nr:MAG: hypothetical protein EHM18_03845 [Acidobacteriota bacterium]